VFVGHYSASFVGKTFAPRVPFWMMLLAAQLVDVAWAVFVLLGIEHVHLDPTLASNPLVLDHMPYTHSLLATLGWAALAALVVSTLPRLGGPQSAWIVAAVVASHWALDVLVHRPDMTLLGVDPPFGLGLWDYPFFAFVIEVAVLTGAAAFYAAHRRIGDAERRAVLRGVGVLLALQTFTVVGPIPTSTTALVVSTLSTFLLVTFAGARMERRLGR
jgi:hypothetical protein